MSDSLVATLSVHLACQLICTGNNSVENNFSIDNLVPTQTIVIPDDYTQFPDIGMAYKYYNVSQITWNSARKACIAHDSNLAVIDSFKKVNYINSLKDNPHNSGIFVGIHRLYGNGEWVSVKTGLPVNAIPWAPETHEEGQGNNCLASWNDERGLSAISCNDKKHYICEIPLK